MAGDLAKIPVTIVTGFLGAGKTTLIRHVLANAQGRRLALVINEFGDVGVDGEILRNCGVELLPRGQYRRTGQWLPVLHRGRRFPAGDRRPAGARAAPDHILIETSRPRAAKPLVKAFDWPEISARLTVDGVIAVVDAAAVADGPFRRRRRKAQSPARAGRGARPRQSAGGSLRGSTALRRSDPAQQVRSVVRGGVWRKCAWKSRRKFPARSKSSRRVRGSWTSNVLLGLAAAAEDDLARAPLASRYGGGARPR